MLEITSPADILCLTLISDHVGGVNTLVHGNAKSYTPTKVSISRLKTAAED